MVSDYYTFMCHAYYLTYFFSPAQLACRKLKREEKHIASARLQAR